MRDLVHDRADDLVLELRPIRARDFVRALEDDDRVGIVLPGRLTLRADTPPWVRRELRDMGYRLDFQERTSGPINAIFFDWKHGSFWGGSSNHGEDYGIAW